MKPAPVAALVAVPVGLALSLAACDNSSLLGDGAMGNPLPGGGTTGVRPNAEVTASATTGTIPFDVTFSGSTSTHPTGLALTYAWYFSDGSAATGVTVQKRFTQVGTYRARLTVRDAAGAVDTASVVVQAAAPTYACPDLGAPAAGTYLATTCDAQGTLYAPAAFYVAASGTSGTERVVQLYLLDAAQRVQLKVFGTFAPGTTVGVGTYRLIPSSAPRSYADFTSTGTLAGRLLAPPIGTLTVVEATADRLTGRLDATFAGGPGYERPLVVRFSALRSATPLG